MDSANDAVGGAVCALRHAAGGHDPWTEHQGKDPGRGGFAWRDDAGNQFDVTISLTRPAPRTAGEREARRLHDAWSTVMLGDDAAHSTDPQRWRFAESCARQVWAGKEK